MKHFHRTLIGTLAVALLLPAWSVSAHAAQKRGGSAFLQSLVVPGWGQYSLGQKRTALMFFGTEVLMLGGILSLRSYGDATRDDYRALAAAHAGVVGDHDHDFYVDVGNWMSVYEYNERRLLDRNFVDLYTDEQDLWQWDSEENRASMEKLRIRSDRAFNNVIYFAAGMALNHLVSAIHAGRKAATMQDAAKETQSSDNLQFQWIPVVRSDALGLRLKCRF